MGCTSCSSGKPGGCQNNGNCGTGGCNKLNTYDWLSDLDMPEVNEFDIIEVSFKNGARKEFYRKQNHMHDISGELVVVEAGNGYDIGRVSLTGDLVRLQMKKKRTVEEAIMQNVLRIANPRDIERLDEARQKERSVMITSRVIARELGLDMKIGDVEFQGDKRKATFYYTAEGRVDFRDLIRSYAREFRVKIEMRQIGARQESARIGGIGSCGRELCCSTWLTDFKSVSTTAARYQNLAINQSKLSGQCGRLKCCLNYELDTYMDALKAFPKRADRLETEVGRAFLVKTDIFKGIMYYVYENSKVNKFYPVGVERVHYILNENKNGKKPTELLDSKLFADVEEEETGFVDVTGQIELPPEEKRRRNKRRGRGQGKSKNRQGQNRNKSDKPQSSKDKPPSSGKAKPSSNSRNKNQRRNSGKAGPQKDGSKKEGTPNKSKNQGGNKPKNQGDNKPNPGGKDGGTKPKSNNKRRRPPRKNTDKKPPKKDEG